MTIKVGDKLPSVGLTLATAEGPKPVTTDEFFGGKKVALFALPGAFTPTCSAKHLPGFKQLAGEKTAFHRRRHSSLNGALSRRLRVWAVEARPTVAI